MCRLELITSKGHTFLSPFVYTPSVARAKLISMGWLVKKGASMRVVWVSKYPTAALYTTVDATRVGKNLTARVTVLARLWAARANEHESI